MSEPFTKQVESVVAAKAVEASLGTATRVLVVDDDDNDADLIRHALGEECSNLLRTSTGDDAVVLMRQYRDMPFDIIFLDLKLPRLSGVETLALAHEIMPATPVVVITAFPSGNFMHEAMRIGYVELAIKPLKRETIVKIFRTHKIGAPARPAAGIPS